MKNDCRGAVEEPTQDAEGRWEVVPRCTCSWSAPKVVARSAFEATDRALDIVQVHLFPPAPGTVQTRSAEPQPVGRPPLASITPLVGMGAEDDYTRPAAGGGRSNVLAATLFVLALLVVVPLTIAFLVDRNSGYERPVAERETYPQADEDPSDEIDPSMLASPTDDPLPDEEPEVAEEPDLPLDDPAEEEVATGLPADLAERGVNESMASVAQSISIDTGYTPAGFDDNEGAYLALVTCDRVAEGSTTWEVEVDEAIASGAEPAAAEDWNAYVRDSFCPQLY